MKKERSEKIYNDDNIVVKQTGRPGLDYAWAWNKGVAIILKKNTEETTEEETTNETKAGTTAPKAGNTADETEEETTDETDAGTPKMNNMMCKGLKMTKKVIEGEEYIMYTILLNNYTRTDPDGLIQSDRQSWNASSSLYETYLEATKTVKTEDAAIAACRAWVDEWDYGKPYFCCQQILFLGS